MTIMQNMDNEIKIPEWIPVALSEEEALASFAIALDALTTSLQEELRRGSFNREKAKSLTELLSVVVQEYNFLSFKKETLH